MRRALRPTLLLASTALLLAACDSSSDDGTAGGAATTTAAGGSGGAVNGGGAGGAATGGSTQGGASAGGAPTGGAGGSAGSATNGGAAPTGGAGGAATGGAAATGGSGGAPFDGVFDVSIFVANNCDVSTTPASITVPEGTEFTVNWVNLGSSASAVDVDKIDQYNQVPILIGLEPGESYHDTIREWCGTLFTGTFSFRITGCYEPYYLDVDCGG